jgi:hypothetical protein
MYLRIQEKKIVKAHGNNGTWADDRTEIRQSRPTDSGLLFVW